MKILHTTLIFVLLIALIGVVVLYAEVGKRDFVLEVSVNEPLQNTYLFTDGYKYKISPRYDEYFEKYDEKYRTGIELILKRGEWKNKIIIKGMTETGDEVSAEIYANHLGYYKNSPSNPRKIEKDIINTSTSKYVGKVGLERVGYVKKHHSAKPVKDGVSGGWIQSILKKFFSFD